MESLHHSLGIVGIIIHHSLLKGLVIELLHILGDLVFVYEAPDACSHLTGKQDHKAGEELGERRGQSLDQQAQA